MSGWELYLMLKLDDAKDLFFFIFFFSSMISAVMFIYHSTGQPKGQEKQKRFYRRIGCALVLLALLSATASSLLPTTKEAAVLYVAPKMLNSEWAREDVPEEPRELYGLVKKYLEEQVKEEQK